MPGNILAKITHGSRLFGTTTENSDVDIKTIFVPCAKDILLGRIMTSNRDGTSNVMGKNTSNDTDQDNHDLIKFMRLIEAGSPEGFELLFAPDHAHLIAPTSTWRTLQARHAEFVHADLVPFERLIRKTGTIVHVGEAEEVAARKICALLSRLIEGTGRKKSISPHIDDILEAAGDTKIVRRDTKEGRDGTSHEVLAIAHKSVPVNESIGFAFKLANSIAAEAEANKVRETLNPEQWKHLSLAVRLSSEMIELLQTGMLTFPRPEREFLYDIKVGNVSLENVRDRLSLLDERIAEAKSTTALPLHPNSEAFENFVIEAHLDAVSAEFNGLYRAP